jgi:glycosyltransferase involved in cell wall biosynthesis
LLWLEKVSYSLADRVIVPNLSYEEVALQRGGLPLAKVTVVRNGPELNKLFLTDVDSDIRAQASTIIAYAGAIASQDGVDYLCRALHCLYHTLGKHDFHCLIIGSGEALDVMKQLSRELQVDEKISFLGWVSDPELYARYLSSADICVAPEPRNDYNDQSTFVKILEYMAEGKPIVAFDLVETRRSADTAAVYARPNDVQDFAEKLASLIENPAMRAAIGERGRLRVNAHLAWKYSAPNLLAAYEKVLGKSHNAALLPPDETQDPKTDANVTNASSDAQEVAHV